MTLIKFEELDEHDNWNDIGEVDLPHIPRVGEKVSFAIGGEKQIYAVSCVTHSMSVVTRNLTVETDFTGVTCLLSKL